MNDTSRIDNNSALTNLLGGVLSVGAAIGCTVFAAILLRDGISGQVRWTFTATQLLTLSGLLMLYGFLLALMSIFFAIRTWQRFRGQSGPASTPLELDNATLSSLRRRAVLIALCVGIVSILTYIGIWVRPLWPPFTDFRDFLVWFTPLLGIGILYSLPMTLLVHLGLKGTGWWLAGVPPHRIALNYNLRANYGYVYTDCDMSIRDTTIGTIFPIIVLGGLPLIIGISVAFPPLVLVGILSFYRSSVELVALWELREFDWNTSISEVTATAMEFDAER